MEGRVTTKTSLCGGTYRVKAGIVVRGVYAQLVLGKGDRERFCPIVFFVWESLFSRRATLLLSGTRNGGVAGDYFFRILVCALQRIA